MHEHCLHWMICNLGAKLWTTILKACKLCKTLLSDNLCVTCRPKSILCALELWISLEWVRFRKQKARLQAAWPHQLRPPASCATQVSFDTSRLANVRCFIFWWRHNPRTDCSSHWHPRITSHRSKRLPVMTADCLLQKGRRAQLPETVSISESRYTNQLYIMGLRQVRGIQPRSNKKTWGQWQPAAKGARHGDFFVRYGGFLAAYFLFQYFSFLHFQSLSPWRVPLNYLLSFPCILCALWMPGAYPNLSRQWASNFCVNWLISWHKTKP